MYKFTCVNHRRAHVILLGNDRVDRVAQIITKLIGQTFLVYVYIPVKIRNAAIEKLKKMCVE